MMKYYRGQTLALIILTIVFSACSSSSSPEEVEVIPPGKPNGIAPVNGETCTDYIVFEGDESKAIITFRWGDISNATSYLLQIFEGDVVVNSVSATRTDVEVTLDKGKSFTWNVTALNSDGQTSSDTMSFTTPGQAVSNYAPYAAVINTQFNSETTELLISWVGSDEDGDSLNYNVNVKDSNGVTLFDQSEITETSIAPLSVIIGESYSITVRTTDNVGNYSVSTKTTTIND